MDNQVSLLTYNIFMRPYLIKNNADDHKETRLKLLLHFFKDYDIVCIQEIFDVFTHRRQKLLRRAAKIGFRYFAQAEAPGLFEPFLIDGGLLILSKYPIEKTIFHSFEVGVHADALTKKGVLFTRIKLPLGYVNVFTTHTQASYIEDNKEDEIPSFLTRIKQLISARRFIEKTLAVVASEKDLNLFVGDLNVNANERSYPIDRVLQQFEAGKTIRAALRGDNPNEYDLLMHIFNHTGGNFCFSDCMYEQHNTFKVTYGDYLVDENQPLEQVLTHPKDHRSMQCLDYILRVWSRQHPGQETYQIQKNRIDVEKFFVDHTLITQLSDHYALKAVIVLNDGKNYDVLESP